MLVFTDILLVNKRLRIKSKGKKIYQAVSSFVEDENDGEDIDEEEEDDDDTGTEDPFVDNLIAQLDDLRNKVIFLFKRNKGKVLISSHSGLKQKQNAQLWNQR